MHGPIIKLEIQEMKHQVLHHLGNFHREVSEQVEAQIEEAIKGFQFEQHVHKYVQDALEKSVKEYFTYGDGFKRVSEATQTVLNGLFPNPDQDKADDEGFPKDVYWVWKCNNCSESGHPKEVFWDHDGDPRCPECCSSDMEVIKEPKKLWWICTCGNRCLEGYVIGDRPSECGTVECENPKWQLVLHQEPTRVGDVPYVHPEGEI